MEMEKPEEQPQRTDADRSKPLEWDCGSSLYDSFELESLKRYIDSAMSSRTFSMTHLPGCCPGAQLAQPTANRASKRISRPLRKLLQSLFKMPRSKPRSKHPNDGFRFYQSGPLSPILEAPGVDYGVSTDMTSFVRRTNSERLSSASIQEISYAWT